MNNFNKTYIMAVLLLTGMIACTSAAYASSAAAKVMDIKGEADFLKKGNVDWVALEPGMTLSEGDSIKTGKSSTVKLVLSGNDKTGEVDVRPSSQFTFNTFQYDAQAQLDKTLLDVEVGSILVKAEKLKGDSKFEVKTPTSIVGIRGTTFEVNVSE